MFNKLKSKLESLLRGESPQKSENPPAEEMSLRSKVDSIIPPDFRTSW